MKVLITMTTHRRPEWCLNIIKQIKEISKGHEVQVAIFNDYCGSDYDKVISFCQKNGYSFFRTKTNLGKYKFYQLLNLIYAYAEKQNYDTFVLLQDDIILVEDFFPRIGVLSKEFGVVNIDIRNIRYNRETRRNRRITCPETKGSELVQKGNWVDCMFAAKKEIMDGFRVARPLNADEQNPAKGSGTAWEHTKALTKRSDIHLACHSLVEHIGIGEDTVMQDSSEFNPAKEDARMMKIRNTMQHMNRGYLDEAAIPYINEKIKEYKYNIPFIPTRKKVAVVCSAGYLKGKGLGKEIDSADIVVRVNHNFDLIKKHAVDIGERTDIIYIAKAEFELWQKGIKTYPEGIEIKPRNEVVSKQLRQRKCSANTGTIAVVDYAKQGYDVHVYGMDFYAGATGGIINKSPIVWNQTGGKKVKAEKIYLDGYMKTDEKGYLVCGHIAGINDLSHMLEYQNQYKITFDKWMQQTIKKTLEHYQKKIDSFFQIVKGKSVVFVGLAPDIKGKGLGKEIDSHDIVIRTNYFPLPKDLQDDYGTRCDIASILPAEMAHHERIIDAGVEHIIHYADCFQFAGVNYLELLPIQRNKLSDKIKDTIGQDPRLPTAGVGIMMLCLAAQCKSFKFYGITGYQNKKGQVVEYTQRNHYVLNYSGIDVIKKTSKNPMRNYSFHDFHVQNLYLRKLLSEDRIEMDEYSKEYFTCEIVPYEVEKPVISENKQVSKQSVDYNVILR